MEARAPENTPYPADVVAWLAGDAVVDGARTVATLDAMSDSGPDPDLRDALSALGHDVRDATALAEAAVDVVVAVHAPPADLDRAARVLRPGGRVSIVAPARDSRIPWVRKLDRIVGGEPVGEDEPGSVVATLVDDGRFGPVEETEVRYWQHVDRPTLLALVARWPELRGLDEAAREERLRAVGELYDGYGRGPDGMRLPWVARCFRAQLVDDPERREPTAPDRAAREPRGGAPGETPAPTSDPARDPEHDPGRDLAADTDMLLIDFR